MSNVPCSSILSELNGECRMSGVGVLRTGCEETAQIVRAHLYLFSSICGSTAGTQTDTED